MSAPLAGHDSRVEAWFPWHGQGMGRAPDGEAVRGIPVLSLPTTRTRQLQPYVTIASSTRPRDGSVMKLKLTARPLHGNSESRYSVGVGLGWLARLFRPCVWGLFPIEHPVRLSDAAMLDVEEPALAAVVVRVPHSAIEDNWGRGVWRCCRPNRPAIPPRSAPHRRTRKAGGLSRLTNHPPVCVRLCSASH